MIEVKLPAVFTQEFLELIPQQIAAVNDLMRDGSISSYTLNMDRSKLWTVVNAETEYAAESIIQTMPLYKFYKYNIHELMFNNVNSFVFPALSLN